MPVGSVHAKPLPIGDQPGGVLLDNHGIGAPGPGDDHEGHDHAAGEHHGGPFGERSELIFAITSAVLWVLGFVLELTTGGRRRRPDRGLCRRRVLRWFTSPVVVGCWRRAGAGVAQAVERLGL